MWRIFVLLFALIVSGCVSLPREPQQPLVQAGTEEDAAWKTHFNKKYNFSLIYPSDWSASDQVTSSPQEDKDCRAAVFQSPSGARLYIFYKKTADEKLTVFCRDVAGVAADAGTEVNFNGEKITKTEIEKDGLIRYVFFGDPELQPGARLQDMEFTIYLRESERDPQGLSTVDMEQARLILMSFTFAETETET